MSALQKDFKRHFFIASSAGSQLRMVAMSDQQIAQGILVSSFIPLVLKHPRLAAFVDSLRQRFRKAKSYDVASSILLIHIL